MQAAICYVELYQIQTSTNLFIAPVNRVTRRNRVGKASILLVEDDADIQQLVSYNLIKSGFNVTCADSGEEALQILEQEPVDLILLDLMLPGKDGMEVCTIIRDKTDIIQPPIIMLTAKSEEDDIVTGLSCVLMTM